MDQNATATGVARGGTRKVYVFTPWIWITPPTAALAIYQFFGGSDPGNILAVVVYALLLALAIWRTCTIVTPRGITVYRWRRHFFPWPRITSVDLLDDNLHQWVALTLDSDQQFRTLIFGRRGSRQITAFSRQARLYLDSRPETSLS